jgi:protein SCO1
MSVFFVARLVKSRLGAGVIAGLVGLSAGLGSCESPPPRLLTIGQYEVVTTADGRTDTVRAPIPPFRLTDQYGQPFTNASIKGKIVVADFFFASCPTICPVVKKEELRLWEKFKNDPRVVFVSHTIDPRHDSVAVLRDYAERLGVANSNWYFVTGPKDSIYVLAAHYLAAVEETPGFGGGFSHSGAVALVDTKGHMRATLSPVDENFTPAPAYGDNTTLAQDSTITRAAAPVYDGTRAADIDRLIIDLGRLLAEEFPAKK